MKTRSAPNSRGAGSPPVVLDPPRLRDPLLLNQRISLAHHPAAGDRGPQAVDLDDQTACAAVRAHRATGPVGQNDGGVGDAAPARLDDPDRLTRNGGDGASALEAVGQQLLGEFRMNMNGDLRHDPLLVLTYSLARTQKCAARSGFGASEFKS